MQDPNPNPNSTNGGNSQTPRGSLHRRAISEVQFRIPEDLDLADAPSVTSFDELGSEDDLFYTYMDMGGSLGSNPNDIDQKIGGNVAENPSSDGGGGAVEGGNKGVKGKHRHSNSVDGSSIVQSIEAKKAMGPDKLAELWNMDPKRAKRIIANRQSAARSKERKARYILELERKVQNLQADAATLAAQLTLFQRDTSGLANENTDLKIRLQAMEQQAQLREGKLQRSNLFNNPLQ
ncbi:bZIP transcription factor 18 [Linum perenne]